MASVKTACQQPCQLLRNALDASAIRRPDPSEYPPISSIPHTPDSRLRAPPTTPSSVLYLAYGSNLCAETFLGARGIRPLSRVSVSAPALDLTFDLAGLPYLEPCFANTAPRKVPELPDPRDPPKPPKVPPFPPPRPSHANDGKQRNGEDTAPGQGELKWTKGLVGVVYEVTPEDYATIVATEGGGASYADILVPCFPLPPRMSVPEKPPIELPKPFFAHTLYAPAVPEDFPTGPEHPGDGDRGSQNKAHEYAAPSRDSISDEPGKTPKKWYWRFLARPVRPDPSYAQPSSRYLKLITDGAREHELPDDYQRYLLSLHNYTITTWRQRIASWFLMAFLLLFFAVNMLFGKRLADDKGRLPAWLAATIATMFNLLWMGYDRIMKPIFGDGERTQEKKDGESNGRAWRVWKQGRGERCVFDEEKRGLLEDME